MDAADHGRVVLSVIFRSGDVRFLDYASQKVEQEHFADPVQQVLFTLARRYADQAHGIITRAALEDFMRNREPGKALMYMTFYDALASASYSVPEFRHSLGQLVELHSDRKTGEALAQAMQILRHGARGPKGEDLRGASDARAHLIEAFSEIEKAASTESPEGDTGQEAVAVHAAYAKALEHQQQGTLPGVSTGMPELDERLGGGLYRGQLCLVAAWTSVGKTAWCVNLAWNTAVVQGKNFVYFTSETMREDIRLRLVTRHSMLPQFGMTKGERPGLNSRDLRAGTLSEYGYGKFQEVLSDYGSNPAYGRRYIVQLPRGSSLSVIEGRLRAISRMFTPDLVVIDYLALLQADRVRKDRREDLTSILIDANEVARTALDGQGVPLVSPWQVNREGWKAAKENKGYNLAALAEAQEAGNSSDLVLTLLDLDSDDDSRGRHVPLQLDILKNRAGERGRAMKLFADYATNSFTPEDKNSGQQAMAHLLS